MYDSKNKIQMYDTCYATKLDIKGGEKMKKRLCAVRLREDTLEKINKIAEEKQRNTSEIIRIILENYFNQRNLF